MLGYLPTLVSPMDVYYRKKILERISSVLELESFILKHNLYKHFKKFPPVKYEDIQDKICKTEKLSFKGIKPWIKELLNYPESIYNPNFLLCMGWEILEINEFIKNSQIQKSKILANKKKKFPDKYINSTTTRIEYWMSKGYSEELSKLKLSERQRTFSKKICIEKFGVDEGVEIFNNRQKKWINTLKNNPNYNNEQFKKNSYKYSNEKYDELIMRTSFLEKTKKIILLCLDSPTIEVFVDKVLENIEVKRFSDIQPYIYSSIIQNKFNITSLEIKNLFYSKTFYTLNHQTYGVPIYHNGNRYKSIKEYELSIFFEKNNIDFIYEKNYPNSKFKYDFYLPEKDLFIEYYGMLDGKNDENLDERQKKYKEKMIIKNLYCEENDLSLLHNTNYKELIKQIKQIYEINN